MFIYNKINIFSFQSPATPIMEGIIDLHNYIFFYLILVFVFVLWMYGYIIYNFYLKPSLFYDILDKNNRRSFLSDLLLLIGLGREDYRNITEDEKNSDVLKKLLNNMKIVLSKNALEHQKELLETRQIVHGTVIEIVWTVIPSLILVFIAIPSFALLYSMDEIADPRLTVKAIGYQWYWNYEYAHMNSLPVNEEHINDLQNLIGDRENIEDTLVFDSIMLTEDDLIEGYHRLLDVDNPMILPACTYIRVIVTAEDVLHSWAVPSLGVKIDAVPGRLSQVGLYIKYPGVFYGQCSELCGVGHGFMPIVVKVVDFEDFLIWNKNLVGLAQTLN